MQALPPPAQSRHKAYLRGSSKVLEALAVGAPKSLEDLVVLPAKRRALLEMLPAIRQRHRFHLQVSLPGWCQLARHLTLLWSEQAAPLPSLLGIGLRRACSTVRA